MSDNLRVSDSALNTITAIRSRHNKFRLFSKFTKIISTSSYERLRSCQKKIDYSMDMFLQCWHNSRIVVREKNGQDLNKLFRKPCSFDLEKFNMLSCTIHGRRRRVCRNDVSTFHSPSHECHAHFGLYIGTPTILLFYLQILSLLSILSKKWRTWHYILSVRPRRSGQTRQCSPGV
jgi:hypothetical protein